MKRDLLHLENHFRLSFVMGYRIYLESRRYTLIMCYKVSSLLGVRCPKKAFISFVVLYYVLCFFFFFLLLPPLHEARTGILLFSFLSSSLPSTAFNHSSLCMHACHLAVALPAYYLTSRIPNGSLLLISLACFVKQNRTGQGNIRVG